jgi:S1-C subfamily serine protease
MPAPGCPVRPADRRRAGHRDQRQTGLVIINTTLQYAGEAAAGTGMVINADGLVLTNNHVINGSTKITATVRSTGKAYLATVVGYDKTRDIALIQLQNRSGLTTVPIGNSSSSMVGNAVVAMPASKATALNQTITASDDEGSAGSETVTWVSPSGQRTTSSLHPTAGPPQ